MTALLDWFDRYDGPKALTRARGRWKCILGGPCPVTTEYGYTPEAAIENCRALARQRRQVFAEIKRQDREAEEMSVPALHTEAWEQ